MLRRLVRPTAELCVSFFVDILARVKRPTLVVVSSRWPVEGRVFLPKRMEAGAFAVGAGFR